MLNASGYERIEGPERISNMFAGSASEASREIHVKKATEVREVAGETRNRGLACFFYRGPDSKYFKLCGCTVSVVPTHLGHHGFRTATGNISTNGWC